MFPPDTITFDVRITVRADELLDSVAMVEDALANLTECNELIGFHYEGHTAESSIMSNPLPPQACR